MWYTLISVFLLLLLSALFSASETAILTISRAKLHSLMLAGSSKAGDLLKLKQDKECLISSILLGNNLVNTAASTIAAGFCIEMFGDSGIALLIATVSMTVLILILSEVMPKTYAVRHSESVALFISPFIKLSIMVFRPFVWFVRLIVDFVLKRLTPENSGIKFSALETIKSAIDIHHKEGEVVRDYKNMLSGVIDLKNIIVRDVMVHRNECFSINAELPAKQIIEMAMSSTHSRIPLWIGDQDNIKGILHVRDLAKLLATKNVASISTADILSIARDPWFIPATNTLEKQLIAFKNRHIHFGLVVNEYGELEGVVTLEDILEEVVGHIEDEHDEHSKSLKVYHDGSVVADGNMPIRDINRELEWDLEDEDANTIGGLLMHSAQGIPDPKQTFIIGKYELKLIKKTKNKILRVRMKKIEDEAKK